jgi:phosphohistidine swiveling domain-containing protein
MSHFFGLPYIDVRVSFNSFIPSDLPDTLAAKLVDHYVERLIQEPTLHDKVEFEIVFSSYTLDFTLQKKRLILNGFTEEECEVIEKSLRSLTNKILDPINGIYKDDQLKIQRLIKGRESLEESNLDSLGKIYWLIEEAKRYGTLPFAGLARAGFIAVQILKSLVNVGLIGKNDYDNFLGSFSTVSKDLIRDRTQLSTSDFLQKYGHLRPGTYDITSPRYDEAPEIYFSKNFIMKPSGPTSFKFSKTQMTAIDSELLRLGFSVNAEQLIQFIKEAIEWRELAKFEFTKNLSDALSEVSKLSSNLNISKEDISYCTISDLLELHLATTRATEKIIDSINRGKMDYAESLKTLLPPLIVNPMDVEGFEWPTTTPNFITSKKVTAPVNTSLAIEDLSGAIVCIPNADPGFDWIFSYPIAGLVTAWGGANSHMAIRANELGLPAIIGAGEILFRQWSESRLLFIDCANKIVERIP